MRRVQELLGKATAKLAREAGMRRQTRTIVWPYGGNHVTLVTQVAGRGSLVGWPRRSSVLLGPLAASERGSSPAFALSNRGAVLSSSLDHAPDAGIGLPPGAVCFPMHRDDNGCHQVSVQVRCASTSRARALGADARVCGVRSSHSGTPSRCSTASSRTA